MQSWTRIGEADLPVDQEATAAAYAQWTPNQCDCAYCRNVRRQWDAVTPAPIRELLSTAGVEASKPGEFVDFGKCGAGRLAQIEWPFLAPRGTECGSALTGGRLIGSILTGKLPAIELVGYQGGIPCGDAFAAEERWSISATIRGLLWVLPEAEPG